MPCRSYDDADTIHELRGTANRLAQLLCKACILLDKQGIPMPADMLVWWNDHQAKDRAAHNADIARQKEAARRAKLKKEALSKLSKEEQEVLGVKSS